MDAIDQLYQQVILDHAQLRHGHGPLGEDIQARSHQVNPTCGDEVTLGVELDEDGRLARLVWDGQGCSISQASLSMMTDLVQGKTVADIEALREAFNQMMHSRGRHVPDEVLDPLEDAASLQGTSQFPNRIKCALLGWMALRDALVLAGANVKED